MQRTTLAKVGAVVFGTTLVAAACGSDNSSSSSAKTTVAPATTAAAAAGGATTAKPAAGTQGALAGMKGTTPLVELSSDFKARLNAINPNLNNTYNYAAETYDAVVIIALAVDKAKTDGIDYAKEINGITRGGTKCTDYKSCVAIINSGGDPDYDGQSGPLEFSGNGDGPTDLGVGSTTVKGQSGHRAAPPPARKGASIPGGSRTGHGRHLGQYAARQAVVAGPRRRRRRCATPGAARSLYPTTAAHRRAATTPAPPARRRRDVSVRGQRTKAWRSRLYLTMGAAAADLIPPPRSLGGAIHAGEGSCACHDCRSMRWWRRQVDDWLGLEGAAAGRRPR